MAQDIARERLAPAPIIEGASLEIKPLAIFFSGISGEVLVYPSTRCSGTEKARFFNSSNDDLIGVSLGMILGPASKVYEIYPRVTRVPIAPPLTISMHK